MSQPAESAAQLDAWMAVAKALVMARIDRAKLRVAFSRVDSTQDPERVLGGIELRVNPHMPEGLVGVVDQHDKLLGVIDIRGDHSDV